MLDLKKYPHIQHTELKEAFPELLRLLLKDKTTGENLKWGTSSLVSGEGNLFQPSAPMRPGMFTEAFEGIIQPRALKKQADQQFRTRQHGEVFTPAWVVDRQVQAALADFKAYPLDDFLQTIWLELTCGEGPYLTTRYDMATGDLLPLGERVGFVDRKFQRLNQENFGKNQWLKRARWILESAYGYEYQGDSLLLARENVLLTYNDFYQAYFDEVPTLSNLTRMADLIASRLIQMDGLTYTVPYAFEDVGLQTQLNLFDLETASTESQPLKARIPWQGKWVTFQSLTERTNTAMKFDVVIGNPPYQEDRPGTRAKPIYPYFMDSAYQIAEKSILITPARFLFNAGDTKKAWNKKMLEDPHLQVLFYESISSKVFQNTDIKGGVAITYYDKNQLSTPIEVFSPYKEMREILKKLSSYLDKNLSQHAYTAQGYKLTDQFHQDWPMESEELPNKTLVTTNIFDKFPYIFLENKPNEGQYIKIFGRLSTGDRVYRWVKESYIDTVSNFNKYKVFLPKSNGSGQFGEPLSSPIIAEPGLGHTQTFMSLGSFEVENEAEACLKYIKSKFARAMLGILKITQHNPMATWRCVPLQDFTSSSDIDWTKSVAEIDQQLYQKYGLNEEEINFIETHVKEMA